MLVRRLRQSDECRRLGALIGAEKIIIAPIEMMTDMARRFGEGDVSARVKHSRLPSEFVPLARAFNAMAAQLSQRERELVATNDRLMVMAQGRLSPSIDAKDATIEQIGAWMSGLWHLDASGRTKEAADVQA